MGLFVLNEEESTYSAKINEVEFVCEEVKPEYEKIASALVEAYQENLPKLIEFMLDEIKSVFGYMTADELKEALGAPQIDLDREAVAYLEHTLDDTHIIEVEFGGLFDEFYEINIDG